jgi:rubrerythrin
VRRVTRREALAGAGAIPLLGAAEAQAPPYGDREILARLADLEWRTAHAYQEAAGVGDLDRHTRHLAGRFAQQERNHADGLTEAVRSRGGRPARPPLPDEVRGLRAAVEAGEKEILRFLVRLEEAAVREYLDAIGAFRDVRLRSAAISIVAAEGQHLAVLRRALGDQPVPDAFEDGRG